MKKSSFIALVLGTISGMLFSLGMCMALLPEWNALCEGIIFGCIGILLGIITVILWRRMEHKAPLKVSPRALAAIALGVVGALLLGVGMCSCMVWQNLVLGIIIGLVGILMLLCLIPLIKGFTE